MARKPTAPQPIDDAALVQAQREALATLPEDGPATDSPSGGDNGAAADVAPTPAVVASSRTPDRAAADVKDIVRVLYAGAQLFGVKRSDEFEPNVTRGAQVGEDLGAKLGEVIVTRPGLDAWVKWIGVGAGVAAGVVEGSVRDALVQRRARREREQSERRAGVQVGPRAVGAP